MMPDIDSKWLHKYLNVSISMRIKVESIPFNNEIEHQFFNAVKINISVLYEQAYICSLSASANRGKNYLNNILRYLIYNFFFTFFRVFRDEYSATLTSRFFRIIEAFC